MPISDKPDPLPLAPPSSGISAEFIECFPRWIDLTAAIGKADRQMPTRFRMGVDRLLRQLLMADLVSRIGGDDVGLIASTTLPLRALDLEHWSPTLRPGRWRGPIGAEYAIARNAFDLDLMLTTLVDTSQGRSPADSAEQGLARVSSAMSTNNNRGLGGLIHYELVRANTVPETGQIYGTITATPVDANSASLRQVANKTSIELDIKPPVKTSPVAQLERARRPMSGLDLPGFRAPTPLLYPSATQFADKACLLTGEPVNSRRSGTMTAPRFKDVFDLWFMTQACSFDWFELNTALDNNWNWRRLTDGLPKPYSLFGNRQLTRTVTSKTTNAEPDFQWRARCRELQKSDRSLAHYPSFGTMLRDIRDFVDGASSLANLAQWHPTTGWSNESSPSVPHTVAHQPRCLS